jgi:hypothetical protein
MFAAVLAILAQLKSLLGSARFSLFSCRVVSCFALGAFQLDDNSHERSTSHWGLIFKLINEAGTILTHY